MTRLPPEGTGSSSRSATSPSSRILSTPPSATQIGPPRSRETDTTTAWPSAPPALRQWPAFWRKSLGMRTTSPIVPNGLRTRRWRSGARPIFVPFQRCLRCRSLRPRHLSSALPKTRFVATPQPLACHQARQAPGRIPSQARLTAARTRSARHRMPPGSLPWPTPPSSPSTPFERSQRASPQLGYR